MDFSNIPKALNKAILEQFENVAEQFESNEMTYGITEPEKVNHTGYDGFMPYTNGGWDLMMSSTLYNLWSTGTFPEYVPTRQFMDRVIDQSLKDSLKDFCENNKAELEKYFTPEQVEKASGDDIGYHSLYEKNGGDIAERLSEHEMMWLEEGGTFWYQFRVLYFNSDNSHNESGEDEVFFLAGVNTDFEYGRDKGFDTSFQQTVKIKDLTVESIEKIIKQMVDSI